VFVSNVQLANNRQDFRRWELHLERRHRHTLAFVPSLSHNTFHPLSPQPISITSLTTSHIQSAMPSTTAETLSLVNRNVSVAPLVLLSATDHYARSAKGTRKRVVGVLLGQNDGKNVRVSNSFAGRLPQLWWAHDILTVASQCRSRRMKRTRPCGSLTTTTSNP
jgi:hypothetical protein